MHSRPRLDVEHGADLLWNDNLTLRTDDGGFHGSPDQLGGDSPRSVDLPRGLCFAQQNMRGKTAGDYLGRLPFSIVCSVIFNHLDLI